MKRISVLVATLWLAGCGALTQGVQEQETGVAAVDDRLAGTRWRVETIAGQPLPVTLRPAVNFAAGGRLSGMAGCNRFNGRYRLLEDGRLNVTALVVTRKICFPAVMIHEQSLLRVLEDAQSVEWSGTALLLRSSHERRSSRLVALPAG